MRQALAEVSRAHATGVSGERKAQAPKLLASDLAKAATECNMSELPEFLAELTAAQAIVLQRIVSERGSREESDRPLSWREASSMSGGLQLTEDWLKKNRHKLEFCIRVSRKKWFISEKKFRNWLEARRRSR